MNRLLIAALLVGVAAPGLAEESRDDMNRNAQNWQELFRQYPAESIAAREQGTVGFEVSFDKEGYPTRCRVIQSSGFQRLDDSTCQMILERTVFKGLIRQGHQPTELTTRGAVNWILPDTAATAKVQVTDASQVQPPHVAMATTPSSDEKICKRRKVTGTLAGYERVCMTAKEWEIMRQQLARDYGELQGSKGSTSGS